MEFLTHIVVSFPDDMSKSEVASVRESERERSAVLADAGIQRRLWRDPAVNAVWALWSVPDATELDDVIKSLPQFPFMKVKVFALADHPADPGAMRAPVS